MDVRQLLVSLRDVLPLVSAVLIVLAVAVTAVWLLPGRTAAVILGVVAAALLTYHVLRGLRVVSQVALLWLAVGITADAAYARVNDVAPVTIASVLVRLVEALIKLGDILIRSLGLTIIDTRARPVPVATEFVWAFILALIVFLAFSLIRREEA